MTETERMVHILIDGERAREAHQHDIVTSGSVWADYRQAYEALSPHNQLLFKRAMVRSGQASWAYPELPH